MKTRFTLIIVILLGILTVKAQDNLQYQLPPEEITDLVLAPSTPRVLLDGSGNKMLLMDMPEFPSISELAEKEIKVAGIRINPDNNGPSRSSSYIGIKLRKTLTGKDLEIKGLPDNPKINYVTWSPNDLKFAFTNTTPNRIELWIVDVETETAKKVSERAVNSVFPSSFTWVDSNTLVFTAVPKTRGSIPEEPKLPAGPIVQENLGKKAPSRTYQDLIKNSYDESLFEYFGLSELVKVDLTTGNEEIISNASIIYSLSSSPNGKFILLTTIQTPYSYLVPYYRFPMNTQVVDLSGKIVKVIAELPLAENIPVSFNAVRTGRRIINWRNDLPATLYFVEAQDEGDPKNEVGFRDKISTLDAPFDGLPKELYSTTLRFSGISWGNDRIAIGYERWWSNRKEIQRLINPAERTSSVLLERSFEDRYNDPGNPVTKKNEFGKYVLAMDKGSLILFGQGASPEGDKPFVARYNLATKKADRIWSSTGNFYENPVALLNINPLTVLTTKESVVENPNYYSRNLKNNKTVKVTNFAHPYPALKNVKKQVLHYKRADGVDLTLDLYLPADYNKEKGALPGILWAYPREFKSLKAAGQVKGSPFQFTRLYWGSPIYWVTQGYAVLDNTSIPIVGEGENEPNDTFIEQLIASAKAAIDKCAEMGVLDPKRVGVGGHSYGAFMTANLLAHSDLFAAGIARSGAYNRTFTPFGFQAEERTYWEAPDVYNRMSPFMNANKIKRPLLLIHGGSDNNPGTFTIQSERLFNAIKGHGGTTRFVNLPFESHGYKAKESILHTLWEQHQWLEKYVKGVEVPLKESND